MVQLRVIVNSDVHPVGATQFLALNRRKPADFGAGPEEGHKALQLCMSQSRRADPYSAHSGDDRGRDNGTQRDTSAPNTVGSALSNAVGDQHHAQARSDVAQHKENAERIVRQEPDVPGVMDEPCRGADREIPIGLDAQETPGIDKDRVHMSENE